MKIGLTTCYVYVFEYFHDDVSLGLGFVISGLITIADID